MSPTKVQRTLLEGFVIEQPQRGVINLGLAVENLGLNDVEFFTLLGEKGFSFFNASMEEKEASCSVLKVTME
jgi:hypothetical protein